MDIPEPKKRGEKVVATPVESGEIEAETPESVPLETPVETPVAPKRPKKDLSVEPKEVTIKTKAGEKTFLARKKPNAAEEKA